MSLLGTKPHKFYFISKKLCVVGGFVVVMQEYIFEKRPFQMVMFSSLKCDGKVPEEGSELFINNIPKDVGILELKNYFEEVAKLFEIKLMVHSHGENRGFAYVHYWTKDDATNAIKFLRLIEFRKGGVFLNIKTSFNNRRIFLGNIPTSKTKDDLWRTLNNAGYGNIVDVIMYKSYNNYSVNRGYAFVEFKSHEMAARFRAKTVNRLKLWGRTVIVDWAVPYPEPTEETMNQVKKIFLRNLDVLITTKELHRLLCKFIVGFKIQKVYKFKNYAFIHLETRKDAENLFKKLVDHYKDTEVEVEWAKPQSYLTTPEYRQSKVQGRTKVWNNPPQRKRDIVLEDDIDWRHEFVCEDIRHFLGDLIDELNK